MKNTIPNRFTLLFSLLLSLAAMTVSFTHAGSAAPIGSNVDGQQVKSTAQTVVITRNPQAVKAFARTRAASVTEERPMASGRSIITLNEPPFSTVATAVKQNFPDAVVGPNQTYQVLLEPNDTNYSDQWNLPKISAPKAWDITTGASSTVIAVIDTGVLFEQQWGSMGPFAQPDFPDSKLWTNPGEMGATTDEGPEPNCTSRGLAVEKSCNNLDDDSNGMIDDWQGWDFMGGYRGDAGCPNFNDSDTYEYPGTDPSLTDLVMQDSDPQPYSCDDPNNKTQLNKTHYDGACGYGSGACAIGHGTIVGSVATAASNNSRIIAGADWNAKVMNLRVLDGYGFTTTSRVAAAVDYATANGADVINMSLATTVCDETSKDPVLDSALAAAKDAGIISVAASGNENIDSVCFPASSAHTIAVGSSDQNDKRASFSNYGPELDVIAPGTGIPAANSPSKYRNTNYLSSTAGTSLSTPHVAGQASLVKSLYPGTNMQQFKSNLIASSDKVTDMGSNSRTNQHGYGRINLHKSLKHAGSPHPDGTLIQPYGDPSVYIVKNGQRWHIKSSTVFKSYNFDRNRVRLATLTDMESAEEQSYDFREGILLQVKDTHAVYVVNYSSGVIEKRHITSRAVFDGLGYKTSEIIPVISSQVPTKDGPPVNDTSRHPDGTLIQKSGDHKVWWLEDGLRRHIISRAVFESHGFDWGGIKLATNQDMDLPAGNGLDLQEGTLIKGSGHPVYIVNYKGSAIEKRHFSSRFIFELLGYSFDDVVTVNDSQLPATDGAVVE